MLLDYHFDLKSSVAYVVQEWRRQRWNHVCSCPDVLTAEREARYRHCQTYKCVRVLRVSEDELARFERHITSFFPSSNDALEQPTSYDEYLGNV